jgi:TetR/AcrR family transcriptional repressor of nem operon
MQRQIDLFATLDSAADPNWKRVAAIGNWAVMVGAMLLARIADTEELSDEILRATRIFLGAEPRIRKQD